VVVPPGDGDGGVVVFGFSELGVVGVVFGVVEGVVGVVEVLVGVVEGVVGVVEVLVGVVEVVVGLVEVSVDCDVAAEPRTEPGPATGTGRTSR